MNERVVIIMVNECEANENENEGVLWRKEVQLQTKPLADFEFALFGFLNLTLDLDWLGLVLDTKDGSYPQQ